MSKSNKTPIITAALFGLIGGIASQFIFSSTTLNAAIQQPLKTDNLAIVDKFDRLGANFYKVESSGGVLYLNDKMGKVKLQLGTYTNTSQKELPLTALYDSKMQPRLFIRLAGKNESPVLVFKDKNNKDRMMLGLSLDDKSEAPFLTYYDHDGTLHSMIDAVGVVEIPTPEPETPAVIPNKLPLPAR